MLRVRATDEGNVDEVQKQRRAVVRSCMRFMIALSKLVALNCIIIHIFKEKKLPHLLFISQRILFQKQKSHRGVAGEERYLIANLLYKLTHKTTIPYRC